MNTPTLLDDEGRSRLQALAHRVAWLVREPLRLSSSDVITPLSEQTWGRRNRYEDRSSAARIWSHAFRQFMREVGPQRVGELLNHFRPQGEGAQEALRLTRLAHEALPSLYKSCGLLLRNGMEVTPGSSRAREDLHIGLVSLLSADLPHFSQVCRGLHEVCTHLAFPTVKRPPAGPARRKGRSTRMTVEEANQKAQRLMEDDCRFILLSEREQSKRIGCSWQTWKKTDSYERCRRAKDTVAEKQGGEKARTASSPRAVGFTEGIEATVGKGKKDEVLNHLIADQKADYEPSPLEPDPPEKRRRKKVKSCRRV